MRDPQQDIAICEAATPPPWEWLEDTWRGGYKGLVGKRGADVLFPQHCNDGDDGAAWFEELREEDREFIAMSREALPYWINRTQEAESRVRELEQRVIDMRDKVILERERREQVEASCAVMPPEPGEAEVE